MTDKLRAKVKNGIAKGPFAASWDSLQGYQIPKWYQDAKFGIFIHWGLYAVPAFGNEWYPRWMYQEGTEIFQHHVDTYGPQDTFGYKDFIPMFTAEQYDPKAWAQLFADAGAKFVVPVAEHHDGFQMYDSELSEWNAAQMGPKRDLIGELATAVRAKNMVFGLSSHRAEHWWFFDGGMKFPSDVQDPEYQGLYGPAEPAPPDHHDFSQNPPNKEFLDDWLLRTCELVDKYQPQIVWFDWWIQNAAFADYLKEFGAYYYNRGTEWDKGVAINYKYEAYPEGAAVFDVERGQLSDIRPEFWQTDTSVSKNSWGYIENHDYKQANEIICDLIDIVSKNGALLLNIGPRPDGTIPQPEQDMLLEVGRWLSVHGEAIYETRPWRVFGEGPTKVEEGAFTDTKRCPFTSEDIRFTAKGETLYAIVLKSPTNGQIQIKALGSNSEYAFSTIKSVSLLGEGNVVGWDLNANELMIEVEGCGGSEYPVAVAIRGVTQ